MDKVFKRLVAFLLENRLMENSRLIFLTDGATNIRDRIEKYFAFRERTVIPDWLHLEKKCHEYMSMAVRGGEEGEGGVKEDSDCYPLDWQDRQGHTVPVWHK